MLNPSDYPPGSAEATLAEFIVRWKKRKWESLPEVCQVSWAKKQWGKPHADLLRMQLASFRLIDARLGQPRVVESVSVAGQVVSKMDPTHEPSSVGSVAVDIPITIDYTFSNGVRTVTLLARVICESAPFTPDVNGTWGVNPTSLARVVEQTVAA